MTLIDHDIVLWEAFRNGDKAALGRLFSLYYSPLYKYGCKLCRDTALLEDCLQELFTELWHQKNPAPSISVKAYLLRALKNKLIKQLQKKNNAFYISAEVAESQLFEISHDHFIVKKEADAENIRRLLQAINQLTNRQKEIIHLKFYQNLSYEEVSEIMHINYQVARNLLSQAVQSLKKIIRYTYLFGPFFF